MFPLSLVFLYRTRVLHATSKSVLNAARSSHSQLRYAHLLSRVLLRFRSFAFYESLRCAYRESDDARASGKQGPLPTSHMYPLYMFVHICTSHSYMCV